VDSDFSTKNVTFETEAHRMKKATGTAAADGKDRAKE
jgi:hypothetical protein